MIDTFPSTGWHMNTHFFNPYFACPFCVREGFVPEHMIVVCLIQLMIAQRGSAKGRTLKTVSGREPSRSVRVLMIECEVSAHHRKSQRRCYIFNVQRQY